MSSSKVVSIAGLEQGVRVPQINARVVHQWWRPNLRDKTKLDAVEYLLIDANKDVVQVTLKKMLVQLFKDKLVVGRAYSLTGLTVGPNTGLDRATPHPCHLQIEFSSKVTPLENNDAIPKNCFQFSSFEDIINGRIPTTHYIAYFFKRQAVRTAKIARANRKCKLAWIRSHNSNGETTDTTLFFDDFIPSLLELNLLDVERKSPVTISVLSRGSHLRELSQLY